MKSLAGFGYLIGLLPQNRDKDPNIGAIFPQDDADDFARGAQSIPYEVTDARRAGKKATFIQPKKSDTATWYWQMPDGKEIRHDS